MSPTPATPNHNAAANTRVAELFSLGYFDTMQTSSRVGWLFGVGTLLMILAILLQSITLASQDYRIVLVTALALVLIADGCFLAAFMRGRFVARFASIVLMLPTVFIVADFLRRAPHLFS
jgi:apolipoprotein N-acyltransferase